MQAMVSHWIQHSRKLEAKITEMEHNKVVSELFSQCSMKPNVDRGHDSDDEDVAEDAPSKQIHAPKKQREYNRSGRMKKAKQTDLNTTQYNIDNLFERSTYQANAGSPIIRRENEVDCDP